MKLNDAHKIVKNAMKLNIPCMLWGSPGIGKSSLIHQIGDEMGLSKDQILDLRLAQLEPTDLRGVPMPNRETRRADWYLPAFWPSSAAKDTFYEVETTRSAKHEKAGEAKDKDGRVTKFKKGDVVKGTDGKTVTETYMKKVKVKKGCGVNGPGIVFLDEIEKAPVSVKNASLQLVLDRMIGTYKLPDDWTIVCAGNREEDGCFSAPLGSALANRMIHLDIEANIDAWAEWAKKNNVSHDIIAFLQFSPDLLYKQTNDHAFPSPRTWEIGGKLFDSVDNARDKKNLLNAAVGKGAAQSFIVWNKVYRSVDPEAVLKGEIPSFEGKDQSFKYAVALAVSFHLRKRKGNIKGVEKNVAKFLGAISPELRVLLLQNQSLNAMESMAKSPHFKEYVKNIISIAVN